MLDTMLGTSANLTSLWLLSCSATNLRPLDARMWCAMGQCYENEQLAMDTAAIRCYRRALVNQDREGIAVHKLVSLSPMLSCNRVLTA